MKTIIVVLLALAVANASMTQAQMRASDAVDSALDVLRGLKQTNIDSQALADAQNKTREAEMKAEVQDLTDIADSNKANGDAATEHRKYIENEIDVTSQNLRWIVARREELIRKRSELQEQRCVASMQFVKALKEHDEALQVVAMLKRDVVGIVAEHTGETYEGLAEIKESAQKLTAYAHLFNAKAMQAFNQLTQENPAQAVDAETAEWDQDATDNQKKALEVQHGYQGTEKRDVAHRFIDMINDLEAHLIASVADLKTNEIQAAWDLVNWMQESEKELIFLDQDQDAKTIYIDKLTINVVGAKNREDRLWEIYFESAMTLNDSLAKREVIRTNYMNEKARRDEENIVLDGIVQMFIEQVAILDGKLRAGATDHSDDGSFNSSQGEYNDDRIDAMSGDASADMSAANAAAAKAPYF